MIICWPFSTRGDRQGVWSRDLRSAQKMCIRRWNSRAKMTGKLQPDVQVTSFVSILQVLRAASDTELAAVQLDANADSLEDDWQAST